MRCAIADEAREQRRRCSSAAAQDWRRRQLSPLSHDSGATVCDASKVQAPQEPKCQQGNSNGPAKTSRKDKKRREESRKVEKKKVVAGAGFEPATFGFAPGHPPLSAGVGCFRLFAGTFLPRSSAHVAPCGSCRGPSAHVWSTNGVRKPGCGKRRNARLTR